MSTNTCPDCGKQAWFLDPASIELYCQEHAPAGSIDTLPAIASQATSYPSRRHLMAGVRAEVNRRLADDPDDEIPF